MGTKKDKSSAAPRAKKQKAKDATSKTSKRAPTAKTAEAIVAAPVVVLAVEAGTNREVTVEEVARAEISVDSSETEPVTTLPGVSIAEWAERPSLRHRATQHDIAVRAFLLYEGRGRTYGDPVADWLRAETELRTGT